MKKIAVAVAFVFATLPAFSQDEKAAQAFLESLYNKVASISNNDKGDYEAVVEKHCSRKFRLYYGEARRWEKKAGECMLHRNGGAYDLFIGCQDYFDGIKFSISNVKRTADDYLYTATVAAHFHCEAYKEKEWETQRTVYVTNEDGEWRIADFQSPGEASDLDFMIKELPRFIEAQIASDSAIIAARLETIYNEVARIAHSNSPNTASLDDKYLSQQFKRLNGEIDYWETKLGEMIIDKNRWIRMQEWDRIEYSISDIKITSPSKATADVTATYIMNLSAGEKRFIGKTRLDLILENNNWFIDDFTDYRDDGGLYKWSDSEEYKQGILETTKHLEGSIDYLTGNKQ